MYYHRPGHLQRGAPALSLNRTNAALPGGHITFTCSVQSISPLPRGAPPAPAGLLCQLCVMVWPSLAIPGLQSLLNIVQAAGVYPGSILGLPRLCRVRGRGNVFITAASYLGHQLGPRGRGSHFCTCHVSLTLTRVPTSRSASRQILCILMPKLRNSTRDTLTQQRTEIEPLLPVFWLAGHFHLTVIMDYSPIEVRARAGCGSGQEGSLTWNLIIIDGNLIRLDKIW